MNNMPNFRHFNFSSLKHLAAHHFRKAVRWYNLLPLWHNKDGFYRKVPCFTHSN